MDKNRFRNISFCAIGALLALALVQAWSLWRMYADRAEEFSRKVTLAMNRAAYDDLLIGNRRRTLGLARKPMIIGIKANIHEIARTFRTAYPNARLLYPGKEDFTPENRLRIFSDIKNNNWDCIILTHEQFGIYARGLEELAACAVCI